jgi:hypothetical protein
MNAFLSHLDLAPLFYGAIMFLGLWSMYYKFTRGLWFALTVEVLVFVLVFKLHGGTMAGGFAAMVCALLAGLFFPMIRR